MSVGLDCCNPKLKPLTGARGAVLDMVRKSPKPIGAYALLEQYKKTFPNAAPPTIYRALEYLCKNHWIHRIEKLNAYIACERGHHHDDVQFLICRICGAAHEISATEILKTTHKLANSIGFVPENTIVEVIGHCKDCA